jgi:hypothetical protein
LSDHDIQSYVTVLGARRTTLKDIVEAPATRVIVRPG